MLPCSQFKSTKFKEQVAVQSRFNFLFCEEQSLTETKLVQVANVLTFPSRLVDKGNVRLLENLDH